MSLNSIKMNNIFVPNNEKDINKSNNLSNSHNNNNMNNSSNNKLGEIIINRSYLGLPSDYTNIASINKKNVNSIGYEFSGITFNKRKDKLTFISITLSEDLIHFSNEEIRINDYKILYKNKPLNKMENENKIFCDKIDLNNDVFKINENLDDKSNIIGLFGNISNINNNNNKENNKINIFSCINQNDKNSENSDNHQKKTPSINKCMFIEQFKTKEGNIKNKMNFGEKNDGEIFEIKHTKLI